VALWVGPLELRRDFWVNANMFATEMAKDLKLTDGNPDKVMQAEDMAE
jgi:hypothetical protein